MRACGKEKSDSKKSGKKKRFKKGNEKVTSK
jgi:hypothetical protein